MSSDAHRSAATGLSRSTLRQALLALGWAALGPFLLAAETSPGTPFVRSTAAQRSPAVNALGPIASSVEIDLSQHFGLQDVTGPIVQFQTNLGVFNIELFRNAAPLTVQNFLNYVLRQDYDGSVFHRTFTPLAIIQGGGFKPIIRTDLDNMVTGFSAISTDPPIVLEYNLPNTVGTVAMARTNLRDSATSQFFFNLKDNTTDLGPANGGGYSVFGRVLARGLDVLQYLYNQPHYDGAEVYHSSVFQNLPLYNYSLTDLPVAAEFLTINSVRQISPLPRGPGDPAVLRFEVVASNLPGSVTTDIVGSLLRLHLTQPAGPVIVKVRAVDTNGLFAEADFEIPSDRIQFGVAEAWALGQGWAWAPWFVYYYSGAFPWIYSNEHGWWYVHGQSNGQSWFYDLQKGWISTGPDLYPFAYSVNISDWVNLLQ